MSAGNRLLLKVDQMNVFLSWPRDNSGPSQRTIDDIARLQLAETVDRYKVAVIRNCALSPSDLLCVARMLGTPSLHTLSGYSEPGFPEIMLLSNLQVNGRPIGVADPGRIWHSDSSFLARPPTYTLLHSIEVPSHGGQTLFIDMTEAYRRLSPPLKKLVDNNVGIFSYRPSYEAKRAKNPDRRPLTPGEEASLRDVQHPLKLVHPTTREPALYVNEAHTIGIVGMDESESKALIGDLLGCCYFRGPDYVHNWLPNDLVIWDNRSVIHRGTVHRTGEGRYIRRISIQ